MNNQMYIKYLKNDGLIEEKIPLEMINFWSILAISKHIIFKT